uniref:OCEL domain-containing protein n=1 Tax=Equus asinus asinus TaxID=83772 RepID=A0A8C4L799_EQUAS
FLRRLQRVEASAPCRLCQPQPGAHRARPKKIVFEDELPSPVLGTKKSIGTIPGRRIPRPQPVPDYELKYPAVNSERGRRRYAAVFQDQYPEFLELQQEVGAAQAKLRQLEALLNSLPPPRSQVSHLVDPCRGLRASHWLQVSRPLPPPGWVGTTVHGSRSAPEVLPRWVTLSFGASVSPSLLGSSFSEPPSSFSPCRRRHTSLPASGGNLRRSRW